MLYLHTSNQLEQLSLAFAKTVNTPLKGVFTKEMIIVQNAGMARWLSMQLADIAGISANLEYSFPAEFMWKLLRMVSSDISEQSQCTPETLCYHIMQELTLNHEAYPELAHYILHQNKNLNDTATWELACQLADIFDQYLFFRSEWIQQWEENPEKFIKDDWQARLWVRCVKEKQLVHWKALQDQFKQSLHSIDKASLLDKLPERVIFFSMPALSPGYLDLLGELAQLTDIHLFLINPCEDIYWGDIISEKSQAKLTLDEQAYAETGNPLLASMGKQGRDFIHQLLDIPETEHFSTTENATQNENKKTLLQQLQTDIYDLKQPEKLNDFIFQDDQSIRLNACHTAMREVEVLHDQILDVLNTDKSLSPADIVVLLPDIESYAPYIEAVFSSSTFSRSKKPLPFSIADRNPINAQQLVEALLKMLKLVDTRFDVESVFEILDYKDISKQFSLDETDVNKCRKLALATNIRWGIDREYRQKNNLPDTQEHTWKYALDGLLLGYAMGENPHGNQLFPVDSTLNNNNALPLFAHNIIEGNEALILANFKCFSDVIFSIADWHNEHSSIDSWITKIQKLLSQIFSETTDVSLILKAINGIKQTTELTNFKQDISFAVFFKILQSALSSISGSENFLGYGITFCAMVPMRSIPFKVIALMGMNDTEYPRQNKRQSFDRLAEKPRKGDRSKRDEDRYLFLESILAARSRLIISYIGQSVKDNTEIPPSVLVSELLDSLAIYSDTSADEWVVKHPLQAFSPRYFDQSSLLYSYAKEYTKLGKSITAPSQIFISERLEELESDYKKVSLNELIKFYQSPARTFLKQRFAIQTFDEDITLPIREPFELESFKDKEIRKLLLVSESGENDQILVARAKGLLPYGEIGQGFFNKEEQIIESFKAQLPEINAVDKLPFSLTFDDFQLYGELSSLGVVNNGESSESGKTERVLLQVSQAYFHDYISIWLHHLVLNAVSNDRNKNIGKYTTFYSPEFSFTLSPVKDAQEQLSQLLVHYWEGLHFPSNFFPKSALSLYENGKAEANIKQAITTWNGNKQRAGEKDKFEHWLLYRTIEMSEQTIPQEFLESAELFFGNLFSHLDEI